MDSFENIKLRTDPSLHDIISNWIEYLKDEKRYSENTLEAYLGDIYLFFNFLTEHKGKIADVELLKGLGLSDFRGFLQALAIRE